jgi:hypothetical protein
MDYLIHGPQLSKCSPLEVINFPTPSLGVVSTPMLLGFNQATGHPSAPWIQPSHWPPQCFLDSTKPLAIPVLLGFNQATGHPSAPWIQPSHRPSQYSLDSTKPPANPELLGFNQVTNHPSALWIHPSHQSMLVLLGLI